MPIVIDKDIPAYKILTGERIFVMDSDRATLQDIRPIEIAILNLMPTKETTETQFMRLLSNSPLQVNITLIRTATYNPTHTEAAHLERFYKNFSDIRGRRFDGMIITGAPVENMEFEDVAYWRELEDIFDWTRTNVTSTIFICWGAQAALYHFYGIGKQLLERKLFGIYPTRAMQENDMLLKGMDDTFYIPHSRHTRVDEDALRRCPDIKILAESPVAGISIAKTHDNKSFFFTEAMRYAGNIMGGADGVRCNYAVVANVYYPEQQPLKSRLEGKRQWTNNLAYGPIQRLNPRIAHMKEDFDECVTAHVLLNWCKLGKTQVRFSFQSGIH